MNIRVFSLLALAALPLVAQAQPDPNVAPKGDNPANRAVRARGARVITPEDRFKRQLVQANVTNEAQQTAVITYITGELKARQKMVETAKTLQTNLRNRNVTDAQVAGLLNDYNVGVTDDKTRHQKALTTLKAAIDITQYPRLEAMLTLAGLYGDAPALSTGGLSALTGQGKAKQTLRAAKAGRVGGANGVAPF